MAKKSKQEKIQGINGNLTLQELIVKTQSFLNQKITREEYDEWSNKFLIKSNLSSMQKLSYLISLVTVYNYTPNVSNEMLIAELYKHFFFRVYLGGYLDVQYIEENDMTFENYDLLEPIFGPWIESYAQRDINILKDMLKDALSLSTGKNIINALEGVNGEAINKQLEHNKKLIDFLNQDSEKIANLNNIAILNDPAAVKLLEEIKNISLEEAKNSK